MRGAAWRLQCWRRKTQRGAFERLGTTILLRNPNPQASPNAPDSTARENATRVAPGGAYMNRQMSDSPANAMNVEAPPNSTPSIRSCGEKSNRSTVI